MAGRRLRQRQAILLVGKATLVLAERTIKEGRPEFWIPAWHGIAPKERFLRAVEVMPITRLCFPILALTLACVPPIGTAAQGDIPGSPPPSIASDDPRVQMVESTNSYRREEYLPPLRMNDRLMRAAQLHAEQMAQAGRLAHTLDGAPHPKPDDRLAAVQYSWRSFAENVAMGNPDPGATVRGWMGSRTHRDNILSPSHSEIGTGFALDARGRPYWVQVFARPR
jgi:uncharacterized protein YkwD